VAANLTSTSRLSGSCISYDKRIRFGIDKWRNVHVFEHGPGSSVGIATGYGLDGPGIESRWGRDFSHTSRPVLGPTQPPVQ
jgi:hypothetical protein